MGIICTRRKHVALLQGHIGNCNVSNYRSENVVCVCVCVYRFHTSVYVVVVHSIVFNIVFLLGFFFVKHQDLRWNNVLLLCLTISSREIDRCCQKQQD